MRRLFIFLIACFSFHFAFSQSPLDKRTGFFVQNQKLETALIVLSEISEVGISFSNNIIPSDVFVSGEYNNVRVETILQDFIKSTDLKYKVISNQIVIYREVPDQKFTISGFIEDSETGERLIGANVFTSDSKYGTFSNEYGFFSLTLPKGVVNLSFSYLGYTLQTKKIRLGNNTKLAIRMAPSLTLKEVLVLASDSKDAVQMEAKLNFSKERLPLDRLKSLPRLGGEVDLIRATQLLPGVHSGADGIGGLHVRGGNADQNLILLDGVPVYNALHAIGIFSIFNTNAIKSARLIKGDFPARYGGRLSSVMDVRMKEGNSLDYSAELGASLIAADLTVEGPIEKNKSSFFFSGRRALTDLFVKPLTRFSKKQSNEEGFSSYFFYDINGKINFELSPKDRIYLSLYNGGDNFSDETFFEQNSAFLSVKEKTEQDFNWGNTMLALRWNHLHGNKLFSNTTLTYSKFAYQSRDLYDSELDFFGLDTEDVFTLSQYSSDIKDFAIKTDFDYLPGGIHSFKFGAHAINHQFRPGLLFFDRAIEFLGPNQVNLNDTLANSPTTYGNEFSLYAEDQIIFNRYFSMDVGFFASMWNTIDKNYFSFQPRLTTRFALTKNFFLSASYTRMTQYLHLLTNSGIGLPIDLWMPSTAKIKPERSWQGVGSLSYVSNKLFTIQLEGYYKRMDNIITFLQDATSVNLDARNWENEVAVGNGLSYGLEFSVKKQKGNTTGWVSYTYAKSERQFDEINNGEKFPFRYDRTHDLKIVLSHKLNDHVEFSSNWIFSTGSAVTLPLSEYTYESPFISGEIPVYNYGKRNGFRLPDYHRLDLGINFYAPRTWGLQTISLGAYNVYNRKNPLYYTIRSSRTNLGKNELVQVTLLPFVPSISYRIKLN